MNKIRIIGCWICYNNIQTIKHSIMSVYDFVDELVVVDGSFDGNHSDDGTWEIVESIKHTLPKPLTHIVSFANTLYDKHNEHVNVTGNQDPNLFTWQVDSDEVYLPKHAAEIAKVIHTNQYNGIAVKLINVNRIENTEAFTDESCISNDTYQMRIYYL